MNTTYETVLTVSKHIRAKTTCAARVYCPFGEPVLIEIGKQCKYTVNYGKEFCIVERFTNVLVGGKSTALMSRATTLSLPVTDADFDDALKWLRGRHG